MIYTTHYNTLHKCFQDLGCYGHAWRNFPNYTHTRTHARTHARTHTHTHTNTHTHNNTTPIYSHTHTRTNTHTHTSTRPLSCTTHPHKHKNIIYIFFCTIHTSCTRSLSSWT